MTDLPIRCACGQVRGVARELSPATVNRVVCHCRGCMTYAHVLGRAEEILDARGGTDVFQMSPRQLCITKGREQLGCMRVSERGALRFYARCCKTPIAHTLPSLRMPFMAVNHACCAWADQDQDQDQDRDALLGPVRARVNGRFGRAEAAGLKANTRAQWAMLLHYLPLFWRWLVRGDARHSPFVDPVTRKPIAAPERIVVEMVARTPVPARGCG